MIKVKPPIQKLNSFFATKKQFEGEIAMNGLRFNDNLKEVFKDLNKNGEIDKSVITNYKFICCEQYFKREVKYLLDDIELDIFHKTNALAQNDLKCDYIEIQIKELICLAKKTDSLKNGYSEINLANLDNRFNVLCSTLINLNDKSIIDIRTSDDLIDDILTYGKIIKSISLPDNDLVKLFDFNYSDVYKICLIELTDLIITVIGRIVKANQFILEEKFNLLEKPPFMISREQFIPFVEQKTEPIIEETNGNNLDLKLSLNETPQSLISNDNPELLKTKVEILRENLTQYGFFEIEKVKLLSNENKELLLINISKSELPYSVAMFDYLLFIRHLEKNHFYSKKELYKEISKWFNKDKEGRAVKGNINALSEQTKENKKRYTSFQHKETVKKDYENLK